MNQIFKIAKHNIRMFFIRPWAILLLFVPIVLSLWAQFLFGNDQMLLIGQVGIYAKDESKMTSILEQELEKAQVGVKYYEDEVQLKLDIEENNVDLGIVMAYHNSYKTLKEGKMPYKLILKDNQEIKEVFEGKMLHLGQLVNHSKSEANFYKLYEKVQNDKPIVETQNEVKQMMTMTTSFSFFIMMFLLTAGIGLSPMMNERELYVYERITVAPLKKYQYILGHVLGAFTILFTQILVQLVSMKCLKISFNLDSLQFVLIGVTLCVVGIGISLLVYAISKKSTIYYLVMGIGVTPLCMLSDTFFPLEFFPVGIQKLAYFSPIRWIMKGYKEMIGGKPLENVIGTLAVALLIATVLILVSLIITSRYSEQE